MNRLNPLEQFLGELGIGVPAGQKLSVIKGQTVRMTVTFSYRGPAVNVTLRCSIGNWGVLFDEIAFGTKTISIPASAAFVPYTAFADIITTPIATGVDYDLESKITEYSGTTLVRISNMIDVIGAAEFSNFTISDYSVV